MRIVLAHKFYRDVGGTEEFVRQVTRLLESGGHEVVPFAMAHPDNWPSPYEKYFVPEIDYRKSERGLAAARRALGTIPRMFYSPDARRRFGALLRDVRPDIVHIQGIYHQISPSILYEASGAGLPIVQTVTDYKLVCPATSLVNGKTHATCTKCLPRLYLNAVRDRCQDGSLSRSALVAAEMWLHHTVLQVYEKKISYFLVENPIRGRLLAAGGIPAAKIVEIPQPFDASTTRSLPFPARSDRARFLYFGRLDDDKGVDVLVEAMRSVDADLDVVGHGEVEQDLRRLAADLPAGNVTFLGPIFGRDLEPYLERSIATVLPSRQMEGTPYAVMQSFASGRAVVATNVGALPDVIDDGRSGLIVPINDPIALAGALSRLVADRDEAARMGAAGRAVVLDRYEPKRYLAAVEGVYASALAPSG